MLAPTIVEMSCGEPNPPFTHQQATSVRKSRVHNPDNVSIEGEQVHPPTRSSEKSTQQHSLPNTCALSIRHSLNKLGGNTQRICIQPTKQEKATGPATRQSAKFDSVAARRRHQILLPPVSSTLVTGSDHPRQRVLRQSPEAETSTP